MPKKNVMKKFLMLMFATLLISSLVSCSPTSSTDLKDDVSADSVEDNLSTYPLYVDQKYLDTATNLPKIIFSTTAKENGLANNIYSFSGTVTDTGLLDEGTPYIIVSTDNGPILVGNLYKNIYDQAVKKFSSSELALLDLDDVNDYVFPAVGETANLICTYQGFSDVFNMPSFCLGANDLFFLDDNDSDDSSDGEDEEGTNRLTAISEVAAKIQSMLEEQSLANKVEFDDNSITVGTWTEGFFDSVTTLASVSPVLVEESWSTMKNNLIKLSGLCRSIVESYGLADVDLIINFLNESDLTKSVISIRNDEVIYDYAEEAQWYSSEADDPSGNSATAPPATESPTQPTAPPATEPPATESQPSSTTTSQKNALKSANQYLKVMAFSRSGLIEQLEYEGYTTEDATYAVDNCGADWMEQAIKKAKSYLDIMAFSHSGLIEQLEYEGFTSEQAAYAADNCLADWMEQVIGKAKNYLDVMPFSHSGLVKQLEYDGFTTEQAEYGADNCGADWMEQAVKKAKNYLDLMSYSRSQLIAQLEYEGFTAEQAEYGASQNGL